VKRGTSGAPRVARAPIGPDTIEAMRLSMDQPPRRHSHRGNRMSTRRSRAEARAALTIARVSELSRRPPSEWPRRHALARYVMLARQAAAGLAGPTWRIEMNGLRPIVLGPLPRRAAAQGRPRPPA